MSNVSRRLERIEKLLESADCICGNPSTAGSIELVMVEAGWSEERIRQEEESKQIACPVHGRQAAPTLRLSGSDVYG